MISQFINEHEFLRLSYSCSVIYQGQGYSSALHAFLASRTSSRLIRTQIANTCNTDEVRALAWGCSLIEGWFADKKFILRTILLSKFSNNDLRAKLLLTGTEEIYNHGDRLTSELLMEIRDYYRDLELKNDHHN